MPTAPQIDAPQTLAGLFPPDSDDDDGDASNGASTGPCYEVQSVLLAGETLRVRQFDYHSHNANRVWPGTFNLADFLLIHTINSDHGDTNPVPYYVYHWGRVLELGTATGLLAMRLSLAATTAQKSNGSNSSLTATTGNRCCCSSIVTSDVKDERGEVLANLSFNYALNDLPKPWPLHVPHTWGTGWKDSYSSAIMMGYDDEQQLNGEQQRHQHGGGVDNEHFDTIVASDILLYVNAYPDLVETLQELMKEDTTFVMSWNRRMKESSEFFSLMKSAGFQCRHEGKCIYTFVRSADPTDIIDTINTVR